VATFTFSGFRQDVEHWTRGQDISHSSRSRVTIDHHHHQACLTMDAENCVKHIFGNPITSAETTANGLDATDEDEWGSAARNVNSNERACLFKPCASFVSIDSDNRRQGRFDRNSRRGGRGRRRGGGARGRFDIRCSGSDEP